MKKLYELRNAVLMSVLVGSYVISGGTAAFAEELKSFNLDEMIVTATATPVESVMKTNAAVNVITREEIQDKHYANLQEVLESIPGYGGFMAANGVGFEVSNYTRPYMRGSDKTVVLIDGVKQNFGGRFYSANAIRNVNDIERIEVLKGTASTLYGAEAVGGVINIITRKHYDKNQGTISASVGNFHTASGQLDYVGENDKTYYALSVMQRHQGDYKDGSGRLRPQDADVTELDLKYGFHIDDKNDLTFKYVNHDQDQTYVEGRGKGNDCPGVGTFRYNTFTAIWDTKGDTAQVQDSSLNVADVEVSDISLNYLGNTLYMTQSTYERAFGRSARLNGIFALLKGSSADQIAFSKKLKNDGWLSISSTAEHWENYEANFTIINSVVVLVTFMAACLSFVVVFTLSNTNISERERELATIKVLGFRRGEVHHYVNKETLILTAIGAALGVPLGGALAESFTYILQMPSLYFDVEVEPLSYVLAVVLSFGFTIIVNLVTNRTLNKIDMVGALKSAE